MSDLNLRSVTYFGVDYTPYSLMWLGAWEDSFGIPVWDTSQGMARSNIKFTPIREVSVRIPTTKLVVVSTTSRKAWGSSVAVKQVCGINTGCFIPKSGVKANAFARSSKHGSFVSYRSTLASGCSSAVNFPAFFNIGCRGGRSSADAAAMAGAAFALIGGVEKRAAIGVQNPSDEEMAAMLVTLVDKRTTKILNNPVRSDIKRL